MMKLKTAAVHWRRITYSKAPLKYSAIVLHNRVLDKKYPMRVQALVFSAPAQRPLAGRDAVHRGIKRRTIAPMAAKNNSPGKNVYQRPEIAVFELVACICSF
jgi:hypothetical protein